MTFRCRPRAGGDPYAAARQCGRARDNRDLGGYGSPPARGRQRRGLCQGRRSTLDSRISVWLLALFFAVTALTSAWPQTARTIRVVASVPAGGAIDALVR